jgi:hypothetical protein
MKEQKSDFRFSVSPGLTKQLLDKLIDSAVEKIPYVSVLVINPDDHKSTGIGTYQYRKLKVQIHKYCPNGTVYLTTKKLSNALIPLT